MLCQSGLWNIVKSFSHITRTYWDDEYRIASRVTLLTTGHWKREEQDAFHHAFQ